jgi:hypothetical protein
MFGLGWIRRQLYRRPQFPTLTVVVEPDHLVVYADWPDPAAMSPQEGAEWALNTATAVVALTRGTGEGLASIQAGLGRSIRTNDDAAWVEEVHRLLANANRPSTPGPRPVVRPTQVLGGRGE